jgi:hypothetical protein
MFISAGEIVWGQLAAFVSGMKSASRDEENLGSTRASSPWRFRAAARPGTWHVRLPLFSPSTLLTLTAVIYCIQITRVNAAPPPFSIPKPTGFLLHHADGDPTSVLCCARRGDTGTPCIARFGSGGWGAEDHGDMVRTIVDIDPEEWIALWSRRWQMYLDGIAPDRYHDDAERWARLDALRTRATFFVDAARAPEVLRLIARYSIPLFSTFFFSASGLKAHIPCPGGRNKNTNPPNRSSTLDEHTKLEKSSSLYPPDRPLGGKAGPSFGCHLFLPGLESDELARLVFSGTRSPLFPDVDELVAFWYDNRYAEYDDVDFESMPAVEPIRG